MSVVSMGSKLVASGAVGPAVKARAILGARIWLAIVKSIKRAMALFMRIFFRLVVSIGVKVYFIAMF